MKIPFICCLVFLGAVSFAADAKPAAPTPAAPAKPKIGKVPEIPATPPRLTVEGTPGAAYAIAFYENQQIKVTPDKLTVLNASITEVATANLITLHSALRSSYSIANQTAKDATMVTKDNDRDQERVDRCQKAYDADKTNVTKGKQLAFAKKDIGLSTTLRRKREEQAAAALETYTKALEAYNQAFAGITPAIDRFVSTAGFPKDRVGK